MQPPPRGGVNPYSPRPPVRQYSGGRPWNGPQVPPTPPHRAHPWRPKAVTPPSVPLQPGLSNLHSGTPFILPSVAGAGTPPPPPPSAPPPPAPSPPPTPSPPPSGVALSSNGPPAGPSTHPAPPTSSPSAHVGPPKSSLSSPAPDPLGSPRHQHRPPPLAPPPERSRPNPLMQTYSGSRSRTVSFVGSSSDVESNNGREERTSTFSYYREPTTPYTPGTGGADKLGSSRKNSSRFRLIAAAEAAAAAKQLRTRTRRSDSAVSAAGDDDGGGRTTGSLPRPDFPPWRNRTRYFVAHKGYLDRVVILVILANSITLAVENHGPNADSPDVLVALDIAFTTFYFIEFVLKAVALGLWGECDSYFGYVRELEVSRRERTSAKPKRRIIRLSWWNIMDFVVMVAGVLSVVIPVISSADPKGGPLSALRAFRLLRPLKAINALPEMRILMRSILQSLPRLLNMLLLFLLLLVTMSIMAVQMWKGMLRNRCFPNTMIDPSSPIPFNLLIDKDELGRVCTNSTDRGHHCQWGMTCLPDSANPTSGKVSFDNVLAALFTLIVGVTLEGWVNVLYNVIDATSLYSSIFFVVLVVAGAFCIMNLTIVIVNNVFDYNIAYEKAKGKLRNGPKEQEPPPPPPPPPTVTANMSAGWLPEARSRDSTVWVKGDEMRMTWPEEKDATAVKGVQRSTLSIVSTRSFEKGIFVVIAANVITLSLWHHGMSDTFHTVILSLNMVFTFVFVFEAALKIRAYGVRNYFRTSWNVFDFGVVVLSVVQLMFDSPFHTTSSAGSLQILRTFQVMKVMKLTQQFPRLQRWARVLLESIKAALTLTMLLVLIVFIYALLGTQLFSHRFCGLEEEAGLHTQMPEWAQEQWSKAHREDPSPKEEGCTHVPRSNFDNLGNSALTLFQILTGEDWQYVMYHGMRAQGDWAFIYFLSWYFIGNSLLLNLFISILISQVTVVRQDDDELKALAVEWKGERDAARRNERSALAGLQDWWQGVSATLGSRSLLSPDGKVRRTLRKVVSSTAFEVIIMIFIVASCVTLCLYNPLHAPDTSLRKILFTIDLINTIVFAFEAMVKIVAYGFAFGEDTYLQRDVWNRVDFVIACASVVSVVTASRSVSNVKLIRTLRVLRPLRVINRSQGLKVALASLFASIPSLGMVILLGLLGWLVFAVMGVQLFHGTFYACTVDSWGDRPEFTNRSQCLANYTAEAGGPRWESYTADFDNIFHSFLSLFELASLEGWVEILHIGMDSVSHEEAPRMNNRPMVAIYFVLFILLGGYFVVNLFVSALVDAFQEQRQAGTGPMSKEQQDWVAVQKVLMRHVKAPILVDPVTGLRGSQRIAARIVTHDKFEFCVNLAVLANVLVLACEHYQEPKWWATTGEIINHIFVALFTIEAGLKILAYTPRGYWLSSWNRFDSCIVVISLVGVVVTVSTASSIGGVVTVFRALRLLRLLKLINAAKGVQALLRTLFLTLPTMVNIMGIMLLIYFCYAVLGVSLFAKIKHGNFLKNGATFKDFPHALLLLLRITTGEAWNGIMHDSVVTPPSCDPHLDECGDKMSYIYFISFVVVGSYIFLNLFVAVLLDSFNDTVADDVGEHLITDEEVDHFFAVWKRFDPLQTCSIELGEVPAFLREIGPPLGPDKHVDSKSLMKKYISPLHNVKVVDGKVGQDALLSRLCLLVYEEATGSKVSKALREDFERHLAREFHAQYRDMLVEKAEKAGSAETCLVKEHPMVQQYTAIFVQAVWRGKLARVRARLQQAKEAKEERDAVEMVPLKSREPSEVVDGKPVVNPMSPSTCSSMSNTISPPNEPFDIDSLLSPRDPHSSHPPHTKYRVTAPYTPEGESLVSLKLVPNHHTPPSRPVKALSGPSLASVAYSSMSARPRNGPYGEWSTQAHKEPLLHGSPQRVQSAYGYHPARTVQSVPSSQHYAASSPHATRPRYPPPPLRLPSYPLRDNDVMELM
eukprot:Sspe_Gene.59734::Locus_32834_Transcript_1_1_Confidence_1.000_Length_6014::g.59734::m.59734/K04851/CACNA1D; voltage-dependent calcium channel L type alpha-1D